MNLDLFLQFAANSPSLLDEMNKTHYHSSQLELNFSVGTSAGLSFSSRHAPHPLSHTTIASEWLLRSAGICRAQGSDAAVRADRLEWDVMGCMLCGWDANSGSVAVYTYIRIRDDSVDDINFVAKHVGDSFQFSQTKFEALPCLPMVPCVKFPISHRSQS